MCMAHMQLNFLQRCCAFFYLHMYDNGDAGVLQVVGVQG